MSFEASAAFNGLVPLSHSGRVSYLYGYVDSAGSEAETTSLLFGWGATGYIWRPWFATTSLGLNIGLTSTESRFSSSEGTSGAGNFNLEIFSRSRFPFSMSYARTDSRSQQFYDVALASGETSFRTTRLTLRQSYRPRKYNQIYRGWYNSTRFDGGTFGSNSQVYGLDYQLRVPQQTVTVNASRSVVKGTANKSSSGAISAGHVYTPSAELGVNSLFSYVEIDPGGDNTVAIDSQAASSFFWRPEHRAINVSGSARLTENKTEGRQGVATRSLSTNLGLGYRVTRALNVSASMSLGASSSRRTQSLSTAQGVSVTYSGGRRQWLGFSHSWQWGASGLNSESRTDQEAGGSAKKSQQSVSTSIGQNLGKSWATGRHSSLAATFSQSGSGSKSSSIDTVSRSLNHSTSLSWNTRGARGSTYISSRLSDSRSFGINDTVFNSFSLNYATDLVINRLSSVNGNASYQVSQNRGSATNTNANKNLAGGLMYRNTRPFGIYNLDFTSQLQGSKQIDTPVPSRTLRWQSVFRYSLGLLSTSLSFRVTESAGGSVVKSMNFQATRTF